MTKSEIYKGFAIAWEGPAATSAGWDIVISGMNRDRQARLEAHVGAEGALTLRIRGTLVDALPKVRDMIDDILA